MARASRQLAQHGRDRTQHTHILAPEPRIKNIKMPASEVTAWQAHRDQLNATGNRQFTSDNARVKLMRVKLKRIYPTVSSTPDSAL